MFPPHPPLQRLLHQPAKESKKKKENKYARLNYSEKTPRIKTWPGGNGITSDKVPTELSYIHLPSRTPSGAGMPHPPSPPVGGGGDPVAHKWGFQPSANNPRLRCLKLFLDRSQTLPPYISPLETAGMLRGVGKTIMDAVTDYLSALYLHTIDTLTRRYGESFMASTPLEWVLTVPA